MNSCRDLARTNRSMDASSVRKIEAICEMGPHGRDVHARAVIDVPIQTDTNVSDVASDALRTSHSSVFLVPQLPLGNARFRSSASRVGRRPGSRASRQAVCVVYFQEFTRSSSVFIVLPRSFCLPDLSVQEEPDRKTEAERSLSFVGHSRASSLPPRACDRYHAVPRQTCCSVPRWSLHHAWMDLAPTHRGAGIGCGLDGHGDCRSRG